MTLDLSADRGLTLGVGLFETLQVRCGEPVLWAQHMARLARGCVRLGLPAPSPDLCRAAVAQVLAAAGLETTDAALRLTWTGGPGARGLDAPEAPAPRLLAKASPLAPPPASLALHLSGVRRNPSSLTSRLKTLSSLDQVAARAEARGADADEALMLNTKGMVACAAAGNVFWLSNDALHTPALACGVLDGIVRGEIIAAARGLGQPVVEAAAPLAALLVSDAVFVTNSLIGLVPVSRLGERAWSPDPAIVASWRAMLPPSMAAG